MYVHSTSNFIFVVQFYFATCTCTCSAENYITVDRRVKINLCQKSYLKLSPKRILKVLSLTWMKLWHKTQYKCKGTSRQLSCEPGHNDIVSLTLFFTDRMKKRKAGAKKGNCYSKKFQNLVKYRPQCFHPLPI